MDIAETDIGGARVRRRINCSGKALLAGHMLSAAEVVGIPTANRHAMVHAGFIEVFPRGPAVGERHIVQVGRGQYDVIQGTKLNAAPLSKEDAEDLATRP